jgi:hypothetical protein
VIGVKFSAVRGTKAHEHVMRFLFGGVCTVLAGMIAERYGPVVGGLFLAFPAIFPAGASLIETHEKQKKREIGRDGTRRGRIAAGVDAEGAALGALALMGFGFVIWKWLPKGGSAAVIAGAVGAWMVGAAVLWGLYRVRWVEWIRRM